MDDHIHEAFKNEVVFVTSPLNYIVYESGFKAGYEYAQKTAHNSEYKQCGHNEKFIGIKSDTNELFCVKCNRVVG